MTEHQWVFSGSVSVDLQIFLCEVQGSGSEDFMNFAEMVFHQMRDDCIEHERYAHESKRIDQSKWTGWCHETQRMRVSEDECAYCGGYFGYSTDSYQHPQMCKKCWDDGKMRGVEKIVKVYIVD